MEAFSQGTFLKITRKQKGRRQGTQKELVHQPWLLVVRHLPLPQLLAVSCDFQQVASLLLLLQAKPQLHFSYFKFLTLSITILLSSRFWKEQISFTMCSVIQLKRDRHLLYARQAQCLPVSCQVPWIWLPDLRTERKKHWDRSEGRAWTKGRVYGTPISSKCRQQESSSDDVNGIKISTGLKNKVLDNHCKVESFSSVHQKIIKREGKAPGNALEASRRLPWEVKCGVLAQSDGEGRARPVIDRAVHH